MAGTVNLYTEEFFSLMAARWEGRRNRHLLATDLSTEGRRNEIHPRCLSPRLSKHLCLGGADNESIMMGIKGPGRRLAPDEIRRRWRGRSNPCREYGEHRGVVSPEQFAALFLMDSAEVKRLTQGVKPLTDQFPKRLTDAPSQSGHLRLRFDLYAGDSGFAEFRFIRLDDENLA